MKAKSHYFTLLLVVLVYSLIALATTYPLARHLADAVPGDIGDPLLNTWIMAWDAHAILTHPLRLFDANIFFPLPNTLAFSEHLFSTAALILPLGSLSGQPVLAYNLSLLLSFPLAGLGMYLLVLRWTGRRGAAFLAGLAYAFAPYRLTTIAHLQLLTIQWLPFSLLALDGLLEPRDGRRWPLAAVAQFVIFTTLQILASWYLAVFTALVLGMYTLGWAAAHLGRRSQAGLLPALGRLALGATIAAGLALPFALPYLDVLPQLGAARPASLAASFAAQPSDFLAAPSYLHVAGLLTRSPVERPGFTEENELYLGIIPSLLAMVGLIRGRPRWRGLTLAAILLVSLSLTFAGPYLALARLLPLLTVVRVPPRWLIPGTFAVAGLAGLGVAGLWGARQWGNGATGQWGNGESENQRIRETGERENGGTGGRGLGKLVFVLVVGGLLVAESFAAPLPLAPVGSRDELPPVYHALGGTALNEPGGWGVVELPMHVAPAPEFPETKRMLASTLGWWGLVNGYSGFTPARQMALGEALAGFPDEVALSALEALGRDGVRYLIVHPGEAPLERAAWEATGRWRAERGTGLLPVGRFGPDDLYLINPYGDALVTNPSAVTDPYWSADAPRPVDVRFAAPVSGAEIRLLAYLYQPDRWEAGRLEELESGGEVSRQSTSFPSEPRLTLFWKTSAPLETDYTVFVHSLAPDGELVGQADGPPLGNHYPTSTWQPGEIVQDSRLVPAGERYLVGLYDPASGERLPAFAPDGSRLAEDAAALER